MGQRSFFILAVFSPFLHVNGAHNTSLRIDVLLTSVKDVLSSALTGT